MAKEADWNDIMRQAIRDSGLSLYRVAKDSGLDVAPLQRFMAGTHGMTLESASKLATIVGLALRQTKRRKR